MFQISAIIILITVHQIDGRAVEINPKQITKMATPRASDDPNKQMDEDVNCVISFTDSKFLSVEETCDEVRKLIEQEP